MSARATLVLPGCAGVESGSREEGARAAFSPPWWGMIPGVRMIAEVPGGIRV